MQIISWLMENFGALLIAVQGVLAALIVLFLLIPGEQPEKSLQAALDFIKKFSRK